MKMKKMKCYIKTQKIEGFEVTIFIENTDYEVLKRKSKLSDLTVDEYIENLIKKECE